jgi:hypothetical protein
MARVFGLIILLLLAMTGCSGSGTTPPPPPGLKIVAEVEGGTLYKAGPVSVLRLSGTYRQMGRQYGALLKDDLVAMYKLAVDGKMIEFYTKTLKPPRTYTEEAARKRMAQIAEVVYAAYPQIYKEILLGLAETSGLDLDKQKLLNIAELFKFMEMDVPPACSGMATWGGFTGGGPLVFGRNNDDDAHIHKDMAKYTVVAVFRPDDGDIPAAIINYAGVIYAPTGMNRDGLFLELNAGNWTHYFPERSPIVLTIQSMLHTYSTVAQLDAPFKAVLANLSSIVNAADERESLSYECYTDGRVKARGPDESGLMAATNHFVDPSWVEIAPPDSTTIARRDNLLARARESKGSIDADRMMKIFDLALLDKDGKVNPQGGATVDGTIYQVATVPHDRIIYLKAPGTFDWQKIELKALLD